MEIPKWAKGAVAGAAMLASTSVNEVEAQTRTGTAVERTDAWRIGNIREATTTFPRQKYASLYPGRGLDAYPNIGADYMAYYQKVLVERIARTPDFTKEINALRNSSSIDANYRLNMSKRLYPQIFEKFGEAFGYAEVLDLIVEKSNVDGKLTGYLVLQMEGSRYDQQDRVLQFDLQ